MVALVASSPAFIPPPSSRSHPSLPTHGFNRWEGRARRRLQRPAGTDHRQVARYRRHASGGEYHWLAARPANPTVFGVRDLGSTFPFGLLAAISLLRAHSLLPRFRDRRNSSSQTHLPPTWRLPRLIVILSPSDTISRENNTPDASRLRSTRFHRSSLHDDAMKPHALAEPNQDPKGKRL